MAPMRETQPRSTPAGSIGPRAAPEPRPGWPRSTRAGELAIGQEFVNESIIGSRFTGRLLEEASLGSVPAVVPEVSGRAWITGMSQYLLDPADPFPAGFSL